MATMLGRVLTYSVVFAAAAAASVVAAGPAEAIVIPSYGFSWHYDSPTSFAYQAWLPGVALNGTGTDSGTSRTTLGTLTDKLVDGNCAVALGSGDNDVGLFSKQVCDAQPAATFAIRAFTGALTFKLCWEPASPPPYGLCIVIKIPSSVGDSALRTTGTGASWTYAPIASWYAFSLTRPGVHVFGNAYDSNPVAVPLSGAVQNTSSGWTCATASAVHLNEDVNASVCAAGQQETLSGTLTGASMTLHACSDGLLGPPWCIAIPLPATLP
ncbi:MAG TPA: hypothetical protein VH561_07345 [Micromonosporaceae bacterium]